MPAVALWLRVDANVIYYKTWGWYGMYWCHSSERKKYQQPPQNDSLFVKQAINNITMNSKNVLNTTQGTQDCDYVFFDMDPL